MMLIKLHDLILPDGWALRASKILSDLMTAAPEDRSALIERRSDLWTELKPLLSKLSFGKCWYCEITQKRSDNPVDHFRPKNKVFERDDHPGYWWLAFDWKNYRFGCAYCNSRHVDKVGGTAGGKRTHFPIFDEKKRALDETISYAQEHPILLDPTSKLDPMLLYFGPDGLAQSAYSEQRNKQFYDRATKSAEIYHLNHVDTKEARLERQKEIDDLVRQGSEYFGRHEQGDQFALDELLRVANELGKKTGAEAEFSAAARSALMRHRDIDWVVQFVTTR
ncbi:MAG: hypothetical protein ACMG6S_11460 [Byssovorax sp.]